LGVLRSLPNGSFTPRGKDGPRGLFVAAPFQDSFSLLPITATSPGIRAGNSFDRHESRDYEPDSALLERIRAEPGQ